MNAAVPQSLDSLLDLLAELVVADMANEDIERAHDAAPQPKSNPN